MPAIISKLNLFTINTISVIWRSQEEMATILYKIIKPIDKAREKQTASSCIYNKKMDLVQNEAKQ